ncbi:holo-ACP synthase [Staphylococcus coagulans]|uniref:holo-ACP synthase n=1 Tax=Staphylococcus coagulans TaxID=74706 RepID=UPI000679FB9E|nr:holo-ACP synthase [Staphylococcus coagulans]AKS66632.1 4'-phosphopantetheinyl transferase [Staphylococcus schleiferi]MBA8775246.1 holo-ACP synthase [Staphylococcus coagulans]MBT2815156.1 holo-ACP synthase [Staphylococcus coagulans]MBT2817667.1 holo-ACP synthase [Staphylococcus coagulans]MBT2838144.1 holo-ACP synthase [Staphylococcus coagulans]
MIFGIGIDLVEMSRMRKILSRQSRFPERVLTSGERETFSNIQSERRRLEFLAGRFAVKEAFSKALGTGIGESVSFQDIHCENDEMGKPTIQYEGFKVHVSITHTEQYAVSQVILEKDE